MQMTGIPVAQTGVRVTWQIGVNVMPCGCAAACGAAAAPLHTTGMPVEHTGVMLVTWQIGVKVRF